MEKLCNVISCPLNEKRLDSDRTEYFICTAKCNENTAVYPDLKKFSELEKKGYSFETGI